MKEKVILAYSGGLDTTAIIPWLQENYDYDVICCCITVFQTHILIVFFWFITVSERLCMLFMKTYLIINA